MVRRAALILASILVLLILLVVLAPLLVPGTAVRDFVVERLESTLNRPVTVAAVKVRILPSLHVALRDLRIEQSDDQTRADAGLDLAVPELQVHLSWRPLLQRRIEITSIDVSEPRISYRASATKDTSTTAPRPTTDVAPDDRSERSGGALEVAIRDLRLHGGTVAVLTAAGDSLLAIGDLAVNLSATLAGADDLTLAWHLHSDDLHARIGDLNAGEGWALDWSAVLWYSGRAGKLDVVESRLQVGELPLAVQGRVTGLRTVAPQVDLTADGGPVQVTSLIGLLPADVRARLGDIESGGVLSAHATVSGSPTEAAAANGTPVASAGGLAYAVDLNLADGRLTHPDLPSALQNIACTVHAEPGRFELVRLSARLPQGHLTLNGSLTDPLQAGVYDLSGEADLHLDNFRGLVTRFSPETEIGGRLAGSWRLNGRLRDDEVPGVDGEVRLTGIRLAGGPLPLPVRDLNGVVKPAGRDLIVPELSARYGTSDLTLRGRLDDLLRRDPTGPLPISGSVAARRLDVDEILAANAAVNRERSASASRTTSSDTGTRTQAAAAGLAQVARLAGTLAVRLDTLQVKSQTLRGVIGDVRFADGVLQTDNARATIFGGRLTADGQVSLAEPERITYDLDLKIDGSRAADLLSGLSTIDRLTRLGAYVTGNLNAAATLHGALNDTFGPDLNSLTSTGTLSLVQARLTDHPMQQGLVKVLAAPNLQSLAVSDWRQSFRLAEGRVQVDGLQLKSGDLSLSGSGWQALDGTLELDLNLQMPPRLCAGLSADLPPEMASLVLDESLGPMALPIRVSGRASSPQVQLAADELAVQLRDRAARKLAAERDRLRQEVSDRAESALSDLLGIEADTTGAAADTTRTEDVKDKLKKLLGDLLR